MILSVRFDGSLVEAVVALSRGAYREAGSSGCRLEEQLGLIILMKFAQMCELPTDSAVTQTASSVPLSQSGDENRRGVVAEKRRPLSKTERGEGCWRREEWGVFVCVSKMGGWVVT